MTDQIVSALLWFSTLGCGLMAGLYFAFSVFIMRALDSLDRAAGIAAMNAINRDILRSLFMPLFFGTTVASLALVLIALVDWSRPAAPAMLAGGLIYVVGMFVVTMACNVPHNNRLAAADPADDTGARTWALYLTDWTRWNHVRTVASIVAMALFVVGIGEG